MSQPSLQLRVQEVRLNSGDEWKTESDQWRFICLQSGTAYWMDQSAPWELVPDELLALSPGYKGLIRASQVGSAIVQWFGFEPESLLGFYSLLERYWIQNEAAGTIGQIIRLPAAHAISQEMGALLRSSSEEVGLVQRARALVLALRVLSQAMPHESEPRRGGAAKDRFDIIMGRLREMDLILYTSEQLARLCDCTPRHFNRLFRAKFGASTRIRQTELRLSQARRLLEASRLPVEQIAADCGFQNLKSFKSIFRRQFGATPGEWRRQSSNGNSEAPSSI